MVRCNGDNLESGLTEPPLEELANKIIRLDDDDAYLNRHTLSFARTCRLLGARREAARPSYSRCRDIQDCDANMTNDTQAAERVKIRSHRSATVASQWSLKVANRFRKCLR